MLNKQQRPCYQKLERLEDTLLNEDGITALSQNLDNSVESKPVWNGLTAPKSLSEVGSRQFVRLHTLRLCINICCITSFIAVLLTNIDHVRIVDDRHSELLGVLLAHLLCFICTFFTLAEQSNIAYIPTY